MFQQLGDAEVSGSPVPVGGEMGCGQWWAFRNHGDGGPQKPSSRLTLHLNKVTD
jgi:hypothetical protein